MKPPERADRQAVDARASAATGTGGGEPSTPQGANRRLSAIMFSDMVGYTALMQDDEALARRNRSRQRAALERHVGAHRGRILQHYGDGALSVFDSAIEAVGAAIAVQRDLNEEPKVALRVGIHTGDVVYDEEGVFGDGVNVTSRIQGLGSPGSVVVSDKVYDEIKNQPHLRAVSLGEFDLKNVRRPIEVFGIVADGLSLPTADALPSRSRQTLRSLAVLPFANMSADPDNEFFSDGITEELINVLTRVNGLQVTARTSSFAFKGRHVDIREIATQLGVESILEGSVRKAGQRVRITAQLIDASSGYHIFSEVYDRQIEDIFETQDEIARSIMRVVADTVTPQDRQARIATSRTGTEAHTLYLQGLHELNRWTPEGTRRSIRLFRRAVDSDPTYANAWAGLGLAHHLIARLGQGLVGQNWEAAESAARRALELDPKQGEAQMIIGLVKLLWEWDFDGAYAALQKALSMSPGSAGVHAAFANYLTIIGEMERAVEEAETAGQLDPLSLPMMAMCAETYIQADRLEDALALVDRILEQDPTFRAAVQLRGEALALAGRIEEGARELDRVVAMTGDETRWLSERGVAYMLLGREVDARRNLELLHEKAARHPDQAFEIEFYILSAALGEHDNARRYLRQAAARKLAGVLYMANSAFWKLGFELPDVHELYEEIGLGFLKRPVSGSHEQGTAPEDSAGEVPGS